LNEGPEDRTPVIAERGDDGKIVKLAELGELSKPEKRSY
jgi:hypothetical protein